MFNPEDKPILKRTLARIPAILKKRTSYNINPFLSCSPYNLLGKRMANQHLLGTVRTCGKSQHWWTPSWSKPYQRGQRSDQLGTEVVGTLPTSEGAANVTEETCRPNMNIYICVWRMFPCFCLKQYTIYNNIIRGYTWEFGFRVSLIQHI